MEADPRLTADELISVAAENGLRASRRLITDWISLGLIDRPHHPGRGQGRGSTDGTWSLPQASLFVDLVTLRQRKPDPVTQVAGLANVPVSAWLWSGEEFDVPVRQVRRALETWCGRHRSRKQVGATRARGIARQMVKQIESPYATRADRDALRQLLEQSIRQSTLDADQLRPLVERVFDPNQVERSLGPTPAQLTAANYSRMLEAQATGYLELETFTEQEFEDARLIYRQNRREYTELQPTLAANRGQSPLRFDDVDFESVLNSACPNLLFTLGIGRLSPRHHHQLAAEARDAEEPQPPVTA
jgi:hypothetical protein